MAGLPMKRLLFTLVVLGAGQVSASCGGSVTLPQWQLTKEAARYAGLDPLLLTALAWEESSYCKTVVSGAGAQGLTQLMPDTAREMGVTDPFDERQNLYGGALYLRYLYLRFQNWTYAILAYHDGATNVINGTYTQAGATYVNRVIGRYEGLKANPVWNGKVASAWR